MKMRRLSPAFLFTLATAFITLALVLFRTVALFANFDPTVQHYASPVTESLATYGFFVPLLLFIPLTLLLPKETRLTHIGERNRFFYLPILVLLIASSIELFVTAVAERLTTLSFLFAILAAIAAGVSALPYLFKLLKLPVSDGTHRLLLAFSAVYMILYAMFSYFDERHYMNNPNAMLITLTATVLALLFFYDANSLTDGSARLTLYLMASGFTLAVSTALPALLYRFSGGGSLVSSLVFELLLLSAALPYALRLFIYGGGNQ